MALTDWHDLLVLFRSHETLFFWLGVLSLALFFGTLIVIPWIIVLLPQDFMTLQHHWTRKWPWYLAVPYYLVKNGCGLLFILTGLAMLILPGQGLLTLFIGLLLIDFPGKHRLIHRIVGQKRILAALNRLRARFGKPHFDLSAS